MSVNLKKSFIKLSVIATLGFSAYLIGFSWGVVGLENNERVARLEQEKLEQLQAQQQQSLAQRGLPASAAQNSGGDSQMNMIVLPTSSEQTTNLSQLK